MFAVFNFLTGVRTISGLNAGRPGAGWELSLKAGCRMCNAHLPSPPPSSQFHRTLHPNHHLSLLILKGTFFKCTKAMLNSTLFNKN